jgi:oligogalacturonide transporter
MTSREFELVQKETARRKGEDSSETTEEEKLILKKVTGFSYEKLWSKENAGLKKQR